MKSEHISAILAVLLIGFISYNSISESFSDFITTLNSPTNGYIQTWFQDDSSTPIPGPSPTITPLMKK